MALANDFKDYALFAEVRSDNVLERKFGITKLPAFVYVTDAADYKSETFKGDFKKDQMASFINRYGSKKFKNTSSDIATELTADIVSTGPCSKTDSNFCLV